MSDTADFAVLAADGQLRCGRRQAGQSMLAALRDEIPDLATQGMGTMRAYFADRFTADMQPNSLADRVLTAIGYQHPTGWHGTVAVSMEEDRTGEIPPLTDEVRATLDGLAAG